MKRKNPYQYLLGEVEEFCRKLRTRHKASMWLYPKKDLSNGWSLNELWERTKAAEQLGYEVQVKATDEGLKIEYIKKIPYIPW